MTALMCVKSARGIGNAVEVISDLLDKLVERYNRDGFLDLGKSEVPS